jgi:hypothetical protein
MPAQPKTLPKGENGPLYAKSSDCPVCPSGEKEQKPVAGFLSLLAAPARRTLENKGSTTVEPFAIFTQKEMWQGHGIGKSVLSKPYPALAAQKLTFRTNN